MIPLSAPLPLRDTSGWGGYREAVVIPHRYGATAGALLQYNAARTEFAWAAHAVIAIDGVSVDGQPVGDWDWRNGVDAQGQPVAIVRFGQPQDEGVTPVARGRGKRHPRTGVGMTNPADVIADVLALAGRSIAESEFSEFRRACAVAGLDVAGSIETADSAQTIARAICSSIGAVFCADMQGWCRLWPSSELPSARATIRSGDLSVTANADNLVNDLTIYYAYENDAPQATMRLEAPDSIARYGRRANTLEARWVGAARTAAAVGERVLQQRARPTWAITGTPTRTLRMGDVIAIDHPASPVTGRCLVLARELNCDTGTCQISATLPAGSVPSVRIAAQSEAFETNTYASIAIATVGAARIFTFLDDAGAPIVSAAVTLDGTLKRYTDAGGRVSFPVAATPPGEHTLVIQTATGPRTTTVLIS